MVVKVGVVGFGTIGKRVAHAVMKQPDMELVGVVKRRVNWELMKALKEGMRIYVPPSSVGEFREKGVRYEGVVQELLERVDIVIDATPPGVGVANKSLYEEYGVRAVFQGGESPEVSEVSFNAYFTYGKALRARYVRVVSCNTTGILRVLRALKEVGELKSIKVIIVRRGADLKEVRKGPIDSLVLSPVKPPSHHALDVKAVAGNVNIVTYAIVAPTTQSHVHVVSARFKGGVNRTDVINALSSLSRIIMVSGSLLTSTSELREMAKDLGRPGGDIYENVVWEDSIHVDNDEVTFVQAIHQEAIVVPENVDAVRAVTGLTPVPEESIKLTDRSLGIGRLLP